MNKHYKWIEKFKINNKRKLRILNIGNIANNGYYNSKLLREIGIEADCLCPNYLHGMACPEWQNEVLTYNDIDFPDFWKIKNFENDRDEIFYQGNEKFIILSLNKKFKNGKFGISKETLNFTVLLTSFFSSNKKTLNDFLSFFFTFFLKKTLTKPFSFSMANILIFFFFFKSLKNKFRFKKKIECTYFGKNTLNSYKKSQAFWKDILTQYDIIIGFSTSNIIPYSNSFKNLISYEHGTMRKIPFEENLIGKLTKSSYLNSRFVFVTNVDCIEKAEKLGISKKKIIAMPHFTINDDIEKFKKSTSFELKKEKNYIFFAPSRQHWIDKDPSLAKGNDKIIKAVKILIKKKILNFKIHFIEWGRDVDRSKQLIKELNIEEYFNWYPPMNKKSLWLQMLKANVILDQFTLEAFGSLTIDAMFLEKRIITNINKKYMKNFFGKIPPIFYSKNEIEISNSLYKVLIDPYDKARVGNKIFLWAKSFHSSDRIMKLQLECFRKILNY